MAEITLKLRRNPSTGKREIVIHLESEADLLPHEHERDHKALVEKILGRALTDEDGDLVVERISKDGQKIGTLGDSANDQAAPAQQPLKQKT